MKYPSREPAAIKAHNDAYYEANRERVCERIRAWRVENRERVNAAARARRAAMTQEQKAQLRHAKRAQSYLRKYGITIAQYDEMLRLQGGVCALCRVPGRMGKYDKLDVDHCHETGRVRGLLCITCNHALGVLGDSAERLERAVAYLKG